ncbi:MAG TPA: hypothetical protein VM782_00545, partial [Stellaceae bacterium]|nr:hypothetical protein [Stellaceae bacterium]
MPGYLRWRSTIGWLQIGMVLAAAALPIAARAQDSNTQARLDRLERDLNMLQRQVYRGPPMPASGGGGPTNSADVEIRMERLE